MSAHSFPSSGVLRKTSLRKNIILCVPKDSLKHNDFSPLITSRSLSSKVWRFNQHKSISRTASRYSPFAVKNSSEEINTESASSSERTSPEVFIPTSSDKQDSKNKNRNSKSLEILDLFKVSPFLILPATLWGVNLDNSANVLQAVGVLALIVFVHECGHFFAARFQGIKVSKFSIGFGPVLSKFVGPEGVEYTLRAIPMGGFVAFPDDDPNLASEISPDDPDLLKNRPILDRAIVISAGVIANIVFAFLVLFIEVNTVGFLQFESREGVSVSGLSAGGAAEVAGIKPGDIILSADGTTLGKDRPAVDLLVNMIKEAGKEGISLEVLRGEDLVEIPVDPFLNTDGSKRIGVQLAPNGNLTSVKADGLGEALVLSVQEFGKLFKTITDGLLQLAFNFSSMADKISGPVAIVAVGAEVARSGASGLFQFAALVNLNLAVVNILPFPALDGGFLFLLLLEALRGGKKLPKEVESGIMSSGIVLLLGSGIFLIVKDTLTLGGLL